jgi:hypothetical protein
MTNPVKLNLKIYQGSTFREVLRWESSTVGYLPISNISKTAPVEISLADPPEFPVGWRVKITGVQGMKEINSTDQYHLVTEIEGSKFEINRINATQYSAYSSGGLVEYNTPVDLTGFTGRLQIRAKQDSPDVILELSSTNGGVLIDNQLKTITIQATAEQTSQLDFTQAVYSLELVRGTEVYQFCNGSVSLQREVTR